MKIKQVAFSLTVGTVAVLSASFLWQDSLLLSLTLLGLAFLKHKIYPLKFEVLLFLLSGLLGSLAESLLVAAGVWFYSQPDWFNIPYWLPFLWGLTGITGITFYQGLVDSNHTSKV